MDPANVVKALEPLTDRGFQTESWTQERFVAAGVCVSKFLAQLKSITKFHEHSGRVLDDICAMLDPATCTVGTMNKHLDWLGKEEGKKFIAASERRFLVHKLTKDGKTAKQACLLRALTDQLNELKHRKNELMSRREKIHGEYQISLLKEDEAYLPASKYEPVTPGSVANLGFALHQVNNPDAQSSEALLAYCRILYGPQVEENNKLLYLENEDVQNTLKTWIERKIVILGNAEALRRLW